MGGCCYGCDNTDFALWNFAVWSTKNIWKDVTWVPNLTWRAAKASGRAVRDGTYWLLEDPVQSAKNLWSPIKQADKRNGYQNYRLPAQIVDTMVQLFWLGCGGWFAYHTYQGDIGPAVSEGW